MKIMPVVDVLDGHVVSPSPEHDFRVLDPRVLGSDDPLGVIRGLCERGGFQEFLVDDLGARFQEKRDWSLLSDLASETELSLNFAAEITSVQVAKGILRVSTYRAVLETRCLAVPEIERILESVAPGRVFLYADFRSFSLSRQSCRLLVSRVSGLIDRLGARGLQHLLIRLRLARLGQEAGYRLALLQDLVNEAGSMRLIVAGGIHTPEDLRRISHTGVSTVAVGRALYSGPLHSQLLRL